MKARHAAIASVALFTLVTAPSRPVAAAPTNAYGFGAEASALGGAAAASSQGASSIFYNPAELARSSGSELLLGYRALSPHLETNHADSGVGGLSSVDAAALGRGSFLKIPVAFGLGLSLSDGHLSRLESVTANQARWVLRDTLPELLNLAAAISVRPARWLALGIGSGYLAAVTGSFDVKGTALLSDAQKHEYDSQLRHAVDADLQTRRYLLLGATVELPKLSLAARPLSVAIALSFRDQARLEQTPTGNLHGTLDSGVAPIPVQYSFETRSLLAFEPRQFVLGVSGERARLRGEVDVGFEQWSRYPSPFARTGTQVSADVPAGLPITLPPSTELPPLESAGFHDRLTLRAGLQHSVELASADRLALRAGYAYLPTPVPRHSEVGRLIDASEHTFSLGGGWALASGNDAWAKLDAFGLFGYLPKHRLERGKRLFFAQGHTFSVGVSISFVLPSER